ncbi:hypothetical protein NGRA_2195 [Nosema granulosis]|uniref:Uncharacterized protein n=1 Tax=Nosema granulosis TaxID=83296 RepID=A0A9P6GXL2_9MICR|nr:hypothetical protein NGRA_2195 [Nosema granulosis]
MSTENLVEAKNEVFYKEISNSEELNEFLSQNSETTYTSETPTLSTQEMSCDVYKMNNFNLGYILKGENFYLFKFPDDETVNFEIPEKENKKILFSERFPPEDIFLISNEPKKTVVNVSPDGAEPQTTIENNLPSRPSIATSTCSSNHCSYPACSFVCCPLRLGNLVSDAKKAFFNMWEEEDPFLDIKLHSLVAEMFCIHSIISKSLLFFYPDVIPIDSEKKRQIFNNLGYTKNLSQTEHDRKLFNVLRRSFMVKRKKYKNLCKKYKKRTNNDFSMDETEFEGFQKNIETVHLILFETLLVDVGITN